MVKGRFKSVFGFILLCAAVFTTAVHAYEPMSYGFESETVVQAESGFVCEYDEYSDNIHQATAWSGSAALKLAGGVEVPDGDTDGMISYTWNIDVPKTGIYRVILNATRPAFNNYYSNWILYANGIKAQVNIGDTEENNETFANWTILNLNKGSNTLTVSVAPRKSGGYFWFIMDCIRIALYEPKTAAPVEIGEISSLNGNVSVDIKSLFDKDFFADVYLISDDKGQPSKIEKKTVLLTAKENCLLEFENYLDKDEDTVKVLVWNSSTMVPCANAKTELIENESTAELNVFEKNKRILLTLPSKSDINYTVYNYFDDIIAEGTAKSDGNIAEISLAKGIDTGWYSVRSGEKQLTAFAVVPRFEERAGVSSPFSTDFAAAWVVKNGSSPDYDRIGQYSRVIKLAGIDWVRERASLGSLNPSRGRYNFDSLHSTIDIMCQNGLKVSSVFHSSPSWAKAKNGNLFSDLTDIYNFMKTAAAQTEQETDSWEIWNEQDEQLYADETADRYAAFLKAAAIGTADGSGNIRKLAGGIAQSPTVRDYSELMLQNDVMRYADAYNYHSYSRANGTDTAAVPENSMRAHYVQKTAYDSSNAPIWITELGVHCTTDSGSKDLALEQKKIQARYSVQGTVSALANGADRTFWFIMPSYNENDKNFGAFSSDDTPNPAYSAMAVMTNVLGKAEYIGELKLESGYGYVFDTGGKAAAVIWSDKECEIALSLTDVYITDIMGKKCRLDASNGETLIKIGPDPVYIEAEDMRTSDCFYPQSYYVKDDIKRCFTDAEKIVISAFPDYKNYAEARFRGYRVDTQDSFPVEVYNFSDKTMSGILHANAEFSGSIEFSEENITIPSMGKAVVYARINAENAVCEEPYNLRIYGVFNGEETTSSVMRFIFSYPEEKAEEAVLYRAGLLTDTTDASVWNVNNISGGSAVSEQADNGVKFSVSMPKNGSNWFYPVFKTPPTYNRYVGSSKGFTFTVTADRAYDNVYLNAMLYYDGAASLFYLGSKPYTIEQGTHTYFVPWKAFVYNTGTSGSERTVTPSKVTSVSIGFNTSLAGSVEYTVSRVGYYWEENSKDSPSIAISGVTDGAELDADALKEITVNSTLNNVILLVNGSETNPENLKTLSKGKYIITAVGYSEWNGAVTDTKTIYVK